MRLSRITRSIPNEDTNCSKKFLTNYQKPIPKEVSLSTRMHLNREQAQELIEQLQVFVSTGDLEEEK